MIRALKLIIAGAEWVIEGFQNFDSLGRKLFPGEHEVVRPPADTRISRNAERLRDTILEVGVRHEELKVLHTFFTAQTGYKIYGSRPTRPLEVGELVHLAIFGPADAHV